MRKCWIMTENNGHGFLNVRTKKSLKLKCNEKNASFSNFKCRYKKRITFCQSETKIVFEHEKYTNKRFFFLLNRSRKLFTNSSCTIFAMEKQSEKDRDFKTLKVRTKREKSFLITLYNFITCYHIRVCYISAFLLGS